ncbi:hypothetical protein HPB48_006997 [Haemaphysalis longicornis]|uniref:Uncharacterized protein n=1 Tax=Haemaphysalis longicornis TaxID=44386 RepID=A0A9J6FQ48_HAELO|nr:hypothetical protein HPB48_006997 [Haemaphysalis longicornis]
MLDAASFVGPEMNRKREPQRLGSCTIQDYETLLSAKRTELRAVLTKKASVKKKRKAAERRCHTLAALAVALSSRPRSVWTLWRPPPWYDTTVPTLSDQDFKGNFRDPLHICIHSSPEEAVPSSQCKQPHRANVQLHSLQSKVCRRKCLWAIEGYIQGLEGTSV